MLDWTAFTSLFHDPWIVHAAFALLVLPPLWHSFRRAGLAPAWALMVAVPLIGFTAALLVLATGRWRTTPPLRRERR